MISTMMKAIAGTLVLANLLAAPAHASLYVVTIQDMKYGTPPAHLSVGDTIRWNNNDIFRHTATAKGEFDVDLKPGASADIVLKHPGVERVTCRFHPTMTVQLVVAPGATKSVAGKR